MDSQGNQNNQTIKHIFDQIQHWKIIGWDAKIEDQKLNGVIRQLRNMTAGQEGEKQTGNIIVAQTITIKNSFQSPKRFEINEDYIKNKDIKNQQNYKYVKIQIEKARQDTQQTLKKIKEQIMNQQEKKRLGFSQMQNILNISDQQSKRQLKLIFEMKNQQQIIDQLLQHFYQQAEEQCLSNIDHFIKKCKIISKNTQIQKSHKLHLAIVYIELAKKQQIKYIEYTQQFLKYLDIKNFDLKRQKMIQIMQKYTYRRKINQIITNVTRHQNPYPHQNPYSHQHRYRCTLNHSEGIFYTLDYDKLFKNISESISGQSQMYTIAYSTNRTCIACGQKFQHFRDMLSIIAQIKRLNKSLWGNHQIFVICPSENQIIKSKKPQKQQKQFFHRGRTDQTIQIQKYPQQIKYQNQSYYTNKIIFQIQQLIRYQKPGEKQTITLQNKNKTRFLTYNRSKKDKTIKQNDQVIIIIGPQ